jgi:hypothetical protein
MAGKRIPDRTAGGTGIVPTTVDKASQPQTPFALVEFRTSLRKGYRFGDTSNRGDDFRGGLIEKHI